MNQMIAAAPEIRTCLQDGHRPGRKVPDRDNPDVTRSECRVCGHSLVHSRMFRRWSITGRLG